MITFKHQILILTVAREIAKGLTFRARARITLKSLYYKILQGRRAAGGASAARGAQNAQFWIDRKKFRPRRAGTRGKEEQERRKAKLLKRVSWYRPADTVLFLPATPNGELAEMARKVVEEESPRLGFVQFGL